MKNNVLELKNHYRINLKDAGNAPVILSGKFKRVWDRHVTFTTIRPYIKDVHTYTVCNHINIHIEDVCKVMELNNLFYNRKYYLICYCEEYKNGNGRMGARLALDITDNPIVLCDDFYTIPSGVKSKCYSFDIEKYVRK